MRTVLVLVVILILQGCATTDYVVDRAERAISGDNPEKIIEEDDPSGIRLSGEGVTLYTHLPK